MDPTDPVIGTTLSGYRVERLMGAGGMGLVYLARHEFIDRRFAVKALKPEVAADAVMARNFLREAQVLSALKHPNIVDIVGFGELADGRHYMVMEFLEGRTLEEELIEKGRVPPERALFLAEQILLALEAAHEAGVIHRDLKPSNVFLTRASGGVEVVKLLDFGLARQQPVALAGLEGERGQTVVAGTPDYISPEQALGQPPGPGCDLYSFGVMMFELLAGYRPFDPPASSGDRTALLLQAHLEQVPPTLEEQGVLVHPALSDLIATCLRKHPVERPGSAAEVRAMLAAFRPATPAGALATPKSQVVTEPILLEPEMAKAVQRRGWKAPVAATAVLLLALAAFALWPSPAPVEAAPPPTPEVAKVEPAVVPAPDELEGLPKLAPPAPPPAPVAAAVVAKKAPTPKGERVVLSVERSDCDPDDRWRAASRVHLQELQSLAAGDDARWTEFERVEPSLSKAITDAATGAQCDAVEQQIRRLAIKWKK